MSNALFDKGREKFLRGEVSWNSGAIDVILVKIGTGADEYDVDLSNDEFLVDIPGNARVALLSDNTIGNTELVNKTTVTGVADADDAVFEEVSGDLVGAVVIYERKSSNIETTSPLLAYIESATGLPIVPTGGNITIEWDDGPNKIFKL